MGADQNLIRAAAQMGPKEWDYSGIMKGISAIGQYISTKKAIANEVMAQGQKAFQSVPSEVFEGKYGDYNLDFVTGAKQEYFNANQIIAKSPAFTKKYKNAVKTINNIKSVLEKNKAGLIKWEQIQNDVLRGDKMSNVSAGIGSEANNRLLDIVLNYETGTLNESITFTNDGVYFYDDELETNINIDDILLGYKGKSKDLVKSSDSFLSIVEKYGKKSAKNNEPFDQKAVKTEINSIIDKLGATSLDDIRSFAYDFSYGDQGTYVQSQSDSIIKITDEELLKQNPEKDPSTIDQIKKNLLADAYDFNNASELEAGLEKWLFDIVEDKHLNTEGGKSVKGNIKLDWTGSDNTAVYLRPTDIPNIAEGVRERTTFVVGGTRFKYLNNQWVWDASGKGDEPVTGSKGQNYDHKDGSDEALLYRLNNNPIISEALKGDKKSKASSDSTSVLPIHSSDSTSKIVNFEGEAASDQNGYKIKF